MPRISPPEPPPPGDGENRLSGAYRLIVTLSRPAIIVPGCLGRWRLERGRYCYVGSARRGLCQRVARHLRVVAGESGGGHWHIDALLRHRYARVIAADLVPGGDECALSLALAADRDIGVPIPGFGATDCRCGCPAHLYRLPGSVASP